ncbi:SRPBCC family protein [Rhizohabitans arisaemae]|uniref:SRPBCC family protein n=1 Tax=Rhizohabitans arisaemae TaxID=2720610 RepID=UPI0024B04E97|nr:SRPBCC domain-containing protein [Rhizohabitans arisaemae]
MSAVYTDKNSQRLTASFGSHLWHEADRIWNLWANPRKLERWWVPNNGVVVERHDLTPGGNVAYTVHTPDGKVRRGAWRVVSAVHQKSLVYIDGHANAEGTLDTSLPTVTYYLDLVVISTSASYPQSRVTVHAVFDSAAQMQKALDTNYYENLRKLGEQMVSVLVYG